jgi:hypothetical protein
MTVNSRIYESFKSADFDIEFFVSEVQKSNRTLQIMAQLEQLMDFIETELRRIVKESSDIIICVANNTETAIGELLIMREHLAPLKDALSALNMQEQATLEKLKAKHAQLKKALELSTAIKKVNKISTEVSKLRAQYPNLKKEAPSKDVLNAIGTLDEIQPLAKVNLVKDDVAWLQEAHRK